MARNLSEQLISTLSPEHLNLFKGLAALATQQAMPLYVVGGFVRDLLLNRPSTDFDFVLEGDAIRFARRVVEHYGGELTTHDKFRTATWTPPASLFTPTHQLPDFVSARRETYAHPAALPDVVLSTLNDDIRRRDFTINTLALRLDGDHFGELIDLLNGEADLKAGLIRILHDQSFVDDPTRIFRAVRYEQRFDYIIEPHTLTLLTTALPYLDDLSDDRLRHELELIFTEAEPNKALARLAQLGVLARIYPDFILPAVDLKINNFTHLLYHLHASVAEQITQRLNLSVKDTRHLLLTRQAIEQINLLNQASTQTEIHKSLYSIPLDILDAAQSLVSSLQSPISSYISRRFTLHLTTNGDTIKTLGLPPGPKYKEILFKLECAWLDEEIKSPEEERTLLERLVAEAKS